MNDEDDGCWNEKPEVEGAPNGPVVPVVPAVVVAGLLNIPVELKGRGADVLVIVLKPLKEVVGRKVEVERDEGAAEVPKRPVDC